MDSSAAATTRTDQSRCQADTQGVLMTSPTGSEAAKSSRGTPTDSDAPQGSGAPWIDPNLGPTATTEKVSMNAISTAGALPETTKVRTLIPEPTTSATGCSLPSVAKPVVKIKGAAEIGRTPKDNLAEWNPELAVEAGLEHTVTKINRRAERVVAPMRGMPLPTGVNSYDTTEALFSHIEETIAEQTLLSKQISALLAYWAISTWFADALPLAPGLAISGSTQEGDTVLQTVRSFCHFPFLMAGVTIASMKNLSRSYRPTILSYEPNLTKQMATFLGCSARRGYMVKSSDGFRDFFGPKAIYVGEDVPADVTLQWSLQVTARATVPTVAAQVPRLTESTVVSFQNQLLEYRLKNLVKVENSSFVALALPRDAQPIANTLGACIVDSPKLQDRLVSLLAPIADQRHTDRSTSPEGLTLEATLSLCHQGKARILVGEIATEVNRIAKARGERLNYSAETVGHRLKKVDLLTRRLGSAGKGLVIDLATMVRIHELAAVYGGVGLDPDQDNVHCPLCIENKAVM